MSRSLSCLWNLWALNHHFMVRKIFCRKSTAFEEWKDGSILSFVSVTGHALLALVLCLKTVTIPVKSFTSLSFPIIFLKGTCRKSVFLLTACRLWVNSTLLFTKCPRLCYLHQWCWGVERKAWIQQAPEYSWGILKYYFERLQDELMIIAGLIYEIWKTSVRHTDKLFFFVWFYFSSPLKTLHSDNIPSGQIEVDEDFSASKCLLVSLLKHASTYSISQGVSHFPRSCFCCTSVLGAKKSSLVCITSPLYSGSDCSEGCPKNVSIFRTYPSKTELKKKLKIFN